MRTVYCASCFEMFTTDRPNKKYCSYKCGAGKSSEKRRANAIEKMRKAQEAKFAPVDEFIRKYYEETGKRINYGVAVAMMERMKKDG